MWCTCHSLQTCNFFPPRLGWRKQIVGILCLVLCEATYCAISRGVHKVRQTWGHCISDFAYKCYISICPVTNHHTAICILKSQEIVGYYVTSFLINDSHLLILINLLNNLRGWFLPPRCTTNRPVTTIIISCGSQNKSQQRLFTGSWLVQLTVFSVCHKLSTFLVVAYLPDFL